MREGEARFVSLAALLNAKPRPPAAPSSEWSCLAPHASSPPPEVEADVVAPPAQATEALASPGRCACTATQTARALRAARLFEATLAEAFDAALERLTRAMAADILGRELRLGAADVTAIGRRMIGERSCDEPLRLHVAAADVGVVCDVPTVVDARLEPGDALLECVGGMIDARLPVRLAAVLAELAR